MIRRRAALDVFALIAVIVAGSAVVRGLDAPEAIRIGIAAAAGTFAGVDILFAGLNDRPLWLKRWRDPPGAQRSAHPERDLGAAAADLASAAAAAARAARALEAAADRHATGAAR